jgi:hypothetical protein
MIINALVSVLPRFVTGLWPRSSKYFMATEVLIKNLETRRSVRRTAEPFETISIKVTDNRS